MFVYAFVLVLVSVHMPVSVSMYVHVHLTLFTFVLVLVPVSLVVSLLVRLPGLVPRCSCGCVSLLGKTPSNCEVFTPNQ